jgi:3',5'-nucleoside bisphosphate phosphatase
MAEHVDLHMHTTLSDGTSSPAELLSIVRSKNLVAFAVTDHDTLAGYQAVKALRTDDDPELITGVELSVTIGEDDVHLLAYLFDEDHAELGAALVEFQKKREQRGRDMVDRLYKMGVKLPFEEVMTTAGNSAVGRPHVAATLLRLKLVSGYQEAFDRYISRGGPAYVPKTMLPPQEAIDLIHRAGGVTVLAHPFIDDMAKHVETLAQMGLDGIEVRHSAHSRDDELRLERIAARHGLLLSGGSDFHGREGRYGMIGSQKVPASYLDKMKEKAWHIRNSH